jgi:hypothetical protein
MLCDRSQASLLGQAEVQNFGVHAIGDKNIRGLDVAMHDAFAVRGVERVGNFDAEVEQRFEFERASADRMFQSFSVEAFHGQVGVAGVLADVVNGADVGMVQRGSSFRLAAETFESLRVARQIFREKFQRDETIQAGVLRFVHDAHATAAKLFDHAVMRNRAVNQGLGIVHAQRMLVARVPGSQRGGTCRSFFRLSPDIQPLSRSELDQR